jgi:UDP-glucose 4-epimerase
MRVLVTGGAGFIGSHVVDGLLAAGHSVAVVDDLSTGCRAHVHPSVRVCPLDIRNPDVADVFQSFRPDVLCHHAAQIDVRRSVADPVADADVNILGSLRLLELCRRYGTPRILFASTGGAMYAEPGLVPTPETQAERPLSPYGVAKLSVEHYLRAHSMNHGARVTVLRYANVYGPRQNPHGEAGVVAVFCERMLDGEAPRIFGDGEQTRDFVFVGDVVSANLAVLDADVTGVFHVGTGIETSINAVHAAARSAIGGARAVHEPARPGEARRSALDATRLSALTGWRARTVLADGIAATAAYFAGTRRMAASIRDSPSFAAAEETA